MECDDRIQWSSPSGGARRASAARAVEFEPRVGDAYRIAMQPPEGELFHLTGEFQEVDPPAAPRVHLHLGPSRTPDDRETLAALSLRGARRRAPRWSSVQGEFATEERRALHEEGWSDSFDRLEALLR